MRNILERAVLTVTRHDGSWAVELDGDVMDQSLDKEGACAAANRRARAMMDRGLACQVVVAGDGLRFGLTR
ncbi:hypothetical protein [Brevundimonas sp.]|uniref:hypothetical protein n=1 Tax=Brevundimonas sp. TaxID=1871086 RepID=UPI00260106E5|nr:hypothetical protein [Brevundimonas sp.]